MRSLKDIWIYAFGSKRMFEEAPAPPPPSPDQIALALAQGFMASGKYDDAAAAISQAWWAVPEFYRCRMEWASIIAPTFWPAQFASPDEGSAATAAYVGQGEDAVHV